MLENYCTAEVLTCPTFITNIYEKKKQMFGTDNVGQDGYSHIYIYIYI